VYLGLWKASVARAPLTKISPGHQPSPSSRPAPSPQTHSQPIAPRPHLPATAVSIYQAGNTSSPPLVPQPPTSSEIQGTASQPLPQNADLTPNFPSPRPHPSAPPKKMVVWQKHGILPIPSPTALPVPLPQ
jgi:hypothetical protein